MGSWLGGPKVSLQRAVIRRPVLLDRPVQRRLLPRSERLHCQRVLDAIHHAAAIHPHALDRPWRAHLVAHALLGAPPPGQCYRVLEARRQCAASWGKALVASASSAAAQQGLRIANDARAPAAAASTQLRARAEGSLENCLEGAFPHSRHACVWDAMQWNSLPFQQLQFRPCLQSRTQQRSCIGFLGCPEQLHSSVI